MNSAYENNARSYGVKVRSWYGLLFFICYTLLYGCLGFTAQNDRGFHVFETAQLNHQQAVPESIFCQKCTKICYTNGLPIVQVAKIFMSKPEAYPD